jgi:ankyrin repeat protein
MQRGDYAQSAIKSGDIDFVRRYLAAGGNVNWAAGDGESLLMTAIWMRRLEIAQVLIDAGAHANHDSGAGTSPLWEVLEQHIQDNADAGLTQRALLRLLLAAGMSVTRDPNTATRRGALLFTQPLQQAVKCRDPEIVTMLLNAGADVNGRDLYNYTPLMTAVQYPDAVLVARFIALGADVNARSLRQMSALMFASEQSHGPQRDAPGPAQLARMLLDAGADAHAVDERGQSALFHAINAPNQQIVAQLIAAKADVNLRDTQMDTPLTYVAWALQRSGDDYGLANIVRQLVAAGADPNAKNGKGVTVRDLYMQRNAFGLLKAL